MKEISSDISDVGMDNTYPGQKQEDDPQAPPAAAPDVDPDVSKEPTGPGKLSPEDMNQDPKAILYPEDMETPGVDQERWDAAKVQALKNYSESDPSFWKKVQEIYSATPV